MSRAAQIKKDLLERQATAALNELARLEEIEERFGDNGDFEEFTILRWDQKYTSGNGRVYSFIAIKCAGFWYTSGIFQHHRMSFDELIDKHLQHAVDGEVWIVTELELI